MTIVEFYNIDFFPFLVRPKETIQFVMEAERDGYICEWKFSSQHGEIHQEHALYVTSVQINHQELIPKIPVSVTAFSLGVFAETLQKHDRISLNICSDERNLTHEVNIRAICRGPILEPVGDT